MTIHAVRAGQLAPTFRLEDLHGGTAAMVELISRGPLVISFYRGLRCSYCERALEALAAIDTEIKALGATQIAIGPAPADAAEKDRLARLPMPVLVDPGVRIAKAYGLPAPPHPATYVIDRNGRIALAAIDPDYRNRLAPRDILSALRCLWRRRTE